MASELVASELVASEHARRCELVAATMTVTLVAAMMAVTTLGVTMTGMMSTHMAGHTTRTHNPVSGTAIIDMVVAVANMAIAVRTGQAQLTTTADVDMSTAGAQTHPVPATNTTRGVGGMRFSMMAMAGGITHNSPGAVVLEKDSKNGLQITSVGLERTPYRLSWRDTTTTRPIVSVCERERERERGGE